MGNPKYQADGHPSTSGPGFNVTLHPQALDAPRRWRSSRLVFVNSMSDLFHARVPTPFIQQVFAVMADSPRHTFQVLTKRPTRVARIAQELPWPANVWLGVTVESVDYVDRLDVLRTVPAAVRFVSAEPLLSALPALDLQGIDWLIAGGESGPAHRPVEEAWLLDLRDQCELSGTAFFFKQWGGVRPKAGGRQLAGRTWDDMPSRQAQNTVQRQGTVPVDSFELTGI